MGAVNDWTWVVLLVTLYCGAFCLSLADGASHGGGQGGNAGHTTRVHATHVHTTPAKHVHTPPPAHFSTSTASTLESTTLDTTTVDSTTLDTTTLDTTTVDSTTLDTTTLDTTTLDTTTLDTSLLDTSTQDSTTLDTSTGLLGASTAGLTGCTGKPADVVFILDSSLSEGQLEFREQLNFVANVTSLLDIGPSDTQISVVTFSTYARVQFHLNEHSTRDSLLDAINKVTSPTGASYTSDALRLARTDSFSANHGRRQMAAWPIVVVMTDGQSSDSALTEREAKALKDTGTLVVAVGIGALDDINTAELQAIASDSAHVFNVTSPDILRTVVTQHIVREIRCAERAWAMPVSTTTTALPVTSSTTTMLPVTSSTMALPPACDGSEAADIIIVLDASGQGGSQEFQRMVTLVRQLIEGFPAVGPRSVQVSVISYGKDYSGDIFFNSFHDKQGVLDHLSSIRLSPGGSNLEEALRADTLKQQQGASLMVVGVGDHVDDNELSSMVSDPARDLYRARDLSQLTGIQEAIRRRICEALKVLSGATTTPFLGKNDGLIG